MEISISELRTIISSSVDAGVQNYIKTKEPENDRIKQADAKRYIEKVGFQPVMLRKWVDERLLTPQKSGSSQNSAVWYSLSEIKELIFTLKAQEIMRKERCWKKK